MIGRISKHIVRQAIFIRVYNLADTCDVFVFGLRIYTGAFLKPAFSRLFVCGALFQISFLL